MFAINRVVAHCQVTLPYLIIALANLQVLPGSVEDITLACSPAHCSLADFLSVRV